MVTRSQNFSMQRNPSIETSVLLLDGGDGHRLDFCLIIGEQMIKNRFFLRYILFSPNGVVSSYKKL